MIATTRTQRTTGDVRGERLQGHRQGVAAASQGFTLVEMLVVITILAILAAMTLFTYMAASEVGKQARTQAQITKINIVVMTKWETYQENYRLPFILPSSSDRIKTNKLRMNAVREVMRMDLPDRITDVANAPVTPGLHRTKLSQQYLTYATNHASGKEADGKTPIPGPIPGWSKSYQGAECLYLILVHTLDREGDATRFFRDAEIQDKDGDGMKEIIDGWGNPIEFLRWAPGFKSALQDRDPIKSPDPFDPYGDYADTNLDGTPDTFALFPLIFSAGPDKQYNITTDMKNPAVQYTKTTPPNNPFQVFTDAAGKQIRLGAVTPPNTSGHFDNITNHKILDRMKN